MVQLKVNNAEATAMCEGDKIEGFDQTAKCWSLEGCAGCKKCIIRCEGCDNCKELENQTLRKAEVGDFIVIQKSILTDLNSKVKWVPAMDMAVGRTGWVAEGNPVDGFTVKFQTTKTHMLDGFRFPQGSLRLALPPDNAADRMIRQTKESCTNENI